MNIYDIIYHGCLAISKHPWPVFFLGGGLTLCLPFSMRGLCCHNYSDFTSSAVSWSNTQLSGQQFKNSRPPPTQHISNTGISALEPPEKRWKKPVWFWLPQILSTKTPCWMRSKTPPRPGRTREKGHRPAASWCWWLRRSCCWHHPRWPGRWWCWTSGPSPGRQREKRDVWANLVQLTGSKNLNTKT